MRWDLRMNAALPDVAAAAASLAQLRSLGADWGWPLDPAIWSHPVSRGFERQGRDSPDPLAGDEAVGRAARQSDRRPVRAGIGGAGSVRGSGDPGRRGSA